jgi:hypothetical protein
VPTSVEFIAVSRTSLGYRLDLIKLLTSQVEKIELSTLTEYEQRLSAFVKDLPTNRQVLATIDLLLDHSLRSKVDQGKLQIAKISPLWSSPITADYHILVGRRKDLQERFQISGYVSYLQKEFNLQSKCVSYDRFVDSIGSENDQAAWGGHNETRDQC